MYGQPPERVTISVEVSTAIFPLRLVDFIEEIILRKTRL